jgi:hypothetical protein
MRRIIRVTTLSGLTLAAYAAPAFACSCATRPVCGAFWEADLVFTGRAEVTPLGPGAQRARFRVQESFHGGTPGGYVEIVGRGIGGSCAYAFIDGTRYLVYAHRASDGTWRSSFCDPTAPLEQAGESLAFVRGISRDSRRGGSIAGYVSITSPSRGGVFPDPVPLVGVMVSVRGAPRSYSLITDSTGSFEIKDIAPGRYALFVSSPPHAAPIPPANIQIKGPGHCVVHYVDAVKKDP